MILLIDNYDSFTYNLAQYLQELGREVTVYRNDALGLDTIRALKPEAIVISPGPGDPDQAGISLEVIRELAGKIPIFGVCLGLQCIGQAFGGKIVRAKRLMHGKTSLVRHDGRTVFSGLRVAARGRALPLAGHRPGHASPPASRSAPRARRGRSWRCATRPCGSRACSSTPSRC